MDRVSDAVFWIESYKIDEVRELSDLFLYAAILMNVSPNGYETISYSLANLANASRKRKPLEIPRYIDLVNPHSEVSEQKRESVLRMAIEK